MAEEVLRQGIHPLFPWKLYINNIFVGDEANSIEDVKEILSREELKLVAAQSEIKFVDRSNYTVLLIERRTYSKSYKALSGNKNCLVPQRFSCISIPLC